MWIVILLICIVVIAAVWYRIGIFQSFLKGRRPLFSDRGIFGGVFGGSRSESRSDVFGGSRSESRRGRTPSRQSTTSDDNLRKEILKFREGNTNCDVSSKGVCEDTIKYYVDLRKRLIEENPDNADKIIIQRHFLKSCPACIRSEPIWSAVVNEYLNGETNRRYIFINNDESTRRTPGVSKVPTVIKMTPGEICKYEKCAQYEDLKKWVES